VESSKNRKPPRESLHDVVDERYRLLRMIGEGGMGRVYEAEHTGIGKRVALKILHAMFSNIKEAVERFRNEARTTTRIANAHIVDVTDSGTTADGRLYFVMEYLDGVELGTLMADGKLSLERTLRITKQIAEALAAAHEQGVIHRDLKPENIILIDRDGDRDFVKVLDFGIALAIDSEQPKRRLTQPGLAVGTPEYMSPEQAVEAKADARSDIYALGAMLYEMATGQQAYKGDTYTQILLNKVQFEPPKPRELKPDLPPDVEAIIVKAMARKPDDRYQSMNALIDDVTKCHELVVAAMRAASGVRQLPIEPPAAPPPPPPRVVAPVPGVVDPEAATLAMSLEDISLKSRSRLPAILGVLALIGAVVGAYVYIWKPRANKTDTSATPAPAPETASAKPKPTASKPPTTKPPTTTATAKPPAPKPPAPPTPPAPAPAPPPKSLKQARALLAKANAAAKKKQWDAATEIYERVARGKFTPELGHLGLAQAALAQGDPTEAVKEAKTSVRLGGGGPARKVLKAAQAAQRKKKR
jgi:serine/threonine protein kinase